MALIKPYEISISDSQIDDLKQRLSLARFPDELDGAEWDLGAPLSDVQRLTAYWKDQFDWRKAEEKLNILPHFIADIQCDGFESLSIHFVHKKSNVDGAVPLLFVHGWPGSFFEAIKIIDILAQGGDDYPAFDVVVPSLPSYGFSEGTKKRGFAIEQYAETFNKLMLRLGYNEYVTQGGDWGFYMTRALALLYPENCKGTHVNMDHGSRPKYSQNPLLAMEHALKPYTKREKDGQRRNKWFQREGSGYGAEHSTKPQTIGYALTDSPVALLAWIYEKLHDWTDSYPWTDEEVCTWISIYWFSTAGPGANVRIYYEATHEWSDPTRKLTREMLISWIPQVKLGLSHFPRDIRVLPSTWTRTMGKVVFEKDHQSGGHFAAWEKPDALVVDVREMFGKGGGAYGVVKGKTGYSLVSARL